MHLVGGFKSHLLGADLSMSIGSFRGWHKRTSSIMMGLLNSGFCVESTCVPSSSLCPAWLCHHPQPHFSATQNHVHSKLPWPRTAAGGADWIHVKHIFSLNPMFSANCINHFQATREQGNTMALPVLPVDCEWKEKGKERGKRETGELETNKSGEEWEGKRFEKKTNQEQKQFSDKSGQEFL